MTTLNSESEPLPPEWLFLAFLPSWALSTSCPASAGSETWASSCGTFVAAIAHVHPSTGRTIMSRDLSVVGPTCRPTQLPLPSLLQASSAVTRHAASGQYVSNARGTERRPHSIRSIRPYMVPLCATPSRRSICDTLSRFSSVIGHSLIFWIRNR